MSTLTHPAPIVLGENYKTASIAKCLTRNHPHNIDWLFVIPAKVGIQGSRFFVAPPGPPLSRG